MSVNARTRSSTFRALQDSIAILGFICEESPEPSLDFSKNNVKSTKKTKQMWIYRVYKEDRKYTEIW
ncbi:hypothetical protein LEP1GSC185_2925 [Leptospira licerasiae serovar Varillal str. VAR 010]|uniref:Uncharacterized protein n=1 Tax=Leptospira licerasiae str. MMD4847 TaxID=1049971 RepID=A0ABN0HB51_9LEPT|nr:hypothetical protein LEP1GSC185_2925 [Leptospira licerasiae serovar Varillal str. VAR 010]EJZ42905.1 hypothetical protein LEP1GSC178_2542 [Leptospira licerasiae str. MMD4847]